MIDIDGLVTDFIKVCALAGLNLAREEIVVQCLNAGAEHRGIGNLPAETMAVYIFLCKNTAACLKAGKVFKNSNARYRYQHYNPHGAKSSLAASLLNDGDAPAAITLSNVGNWIKDNTVRINLLLSAAKKAAALNLLEAFVQARLKPKYEGFKEQG
jgi:hypothetical protein